MQKLFASLQNRLSSFAAEALRTKASVWRAEFMKQAKFMLMWLGIMWLIWLIDRALPYEYSFQRLGIQPRTFRGLLGIPLAPFIHLKPEPWWHFPWHLIGNTVPFFVLGLLVAMGGRGVFYKTTAIVTVSAGLGCWLLGSEGDHYGASGVIFGWFGFLLFRGLFEVKIRWLLVGLAVALVYHTILAGLLPNEGVSWSSHFFGFMGGIASAWLLFVVPRHRLLNELQRRQGKM